MSESRNGHYVIDDGDGTVYYGVQKTNGTEFSPKSLVLYSDMSCDLSTAKLASDIVGTLVPASGVTPPGASSTSPTELVPTFVKVTDAVGIPAGASAITISNIGLATGTLMGTNLVPGETVSFSTEFPHTLAAVAYDATGTEFTIIKTQEP